MKTSKKLHLILKAIKMTFLGYKAESLKNKITKYYYTKGIDNNKYLQKLVDKYNAAMEKFNDLDMSYVQLKDSMTF